MTRFSSRFAAWLCLCAILFAGLRLGAPARADDIAERAKKLHFSSIVLDTHDDTTQRFFSKDEDIRKILGGNLLRVMEQTEKVSRELQAQ